MATQLDRSFVNSALGHVLTLANEIERLECYCSALESKLTHELINEASGEGAKKWGMMEKITLDESTPRTHEQRKS